LQRTRIQAGGCFRQQTDHHTNHLDLRQVQSRGRHYHRACGGASSAWPSCPWSSCPSSSACDGESWPSELSCDHGCGDGHQ
jgi:hypothetical protein